MKTAARSGVFARSAIWPFGGSEIKSWTEGLCAERYAVMACPMMPCPMIPSRIGEGGMAAEWEVPPFTKLPPSLRFPPSFLFPPLEWGREGVEEEGLCGLFFVVIFLSFDEGGGRACESGVRDGLVRLCLSDGCPNGDAVVISEVSEGNGGGCEVVEGSVRVGEVDDVLCDGVVV